MVSKQDEEQQRVNMMMMMVAVVEREVQQEKELYTYNISTIPLIRNIATKTLTRFQFTYDKTPDFCFQFGFPVPVQF